MREPSLKRDPSAGCLHTALENEEGTIVLQWKIVPRFASQIANISEKPPAFTLGIRRFAGMAQRLLIPLLRIAEEALVVNVTSLESLSSNASPTGDLNGFSVRCRWDAALS